jgi:hypothetical protein
VTILDELGYELTPTNAARRSVQKLASTRPMAWPFPGYAKYRRRASHRTIRVFLLRATGDQG